MLKRFLTCLSICTVASLPAFATTADEDPYAKPDDTWITLTGDVVSTGLDMFRLDYGEGLITVEMDDWDWYDESTALVPGERVTVYGMIDDDFYEMRTIEASSVYVFDRNTYFYASAADEEDAATVYYSFPAITVPDGSWMSVTGEVTDIHGREFTVDTGFGGTMRVDTDEMLYNPLDDEGFQQIDVGDHVTVTGTLDLDIFEKREIKASSITTIERDEQKSESTSKEKKRRKGGKGQRQES